MRTIHKTNRMQGMQLRAMASLLVLLLNACAPKPAATQEPQPSPAAPAEVVAISTERSTATASPTSTPAKTGAQVMVSAVEGNLYLRRGPDQAYDPVGVFRKGQSATGIARDVLGQWIEIRIPGQSGRTGWVSIQTSYSLVAGDVSALPEKTPADWPAAAFLRNCTHHDMEADPGGIVIPAVDNFPDNDMRMNPGTYSIHDTQVSGSPEVMQVEIREGSAIDIRTDGDGKRRKCPAP
jgi:hypothetical protein